MTHRKNIITVGMAEVKFSFSPDVLITRGLGSCVGVVFYDVEKKFGGLGHPMLPDITRSKVQTNPAKFVNSVIEMMVDEFKKQHADLSKVQVKICGGGHMFSAIPVESPFNIGVKNVEKVKEMLKEKGLKIAAHDTGGNYGRTVQIDLETGKTTVKTIFHGDKEL